MGIDRLGDLFRMPTVGLDQPAWVLNRPELVKRVMVTRSGSYTKGMGLERVRILLGNGIMVSEGDFWRRQRRMIQPGFAPKSVLNFKQRIIQLTETLAQRWDESSRAGKPINLTDDMSALTLDIVLQSLFGADLDLLNTESGKSQFALVNEMSERNLQFAVKFRALTRLVAQIIELRRERGSDAEVDFLALLMAARDAETGEPMTDKALIDEVMTLVVAGHETTASALNWAWFLLGCHPHAEANLHAELDGLKGTGPGELDQLPYVDAVVQETLRLYPPGWLLTRRAIEDDVIDGFRLKAGTDVFVCPYTLHRHPEYWEDPEHFLPDRFVKGQSENRHRYAYIPFAMGPRRCVGEGFALTEMRLHFALLATRFKLRPVTDATPELEAQVNLRPRHPLHMEVIPR